MDRQKTIPPLSTKITRKLAQESADHNTLMNFYSQISRDETGAPKKWKMSTTLHIDEESIKSKKLGAGKGSGSNIGTPSSSRENSNERKNQINSALQKSQKTNRKSRDDSSSDQTSSRESSVENKSDEKKVRKTNTDKKNRSSSGDSVKHRKSLSALNTSGTGKEKKKRGRRPRSLDLSSKAMANGDDDNFKSPDPLTPCNIAVKRKKGRPKETPPVLFAEPPVESVEGLYDSDAEDPSPPVKRKPGRPRKIKKFNTNQLKSIGKGDKMKSFNMKKYGSKVMKSSLPKGYRRTTKLPKLKPVVMADGSSQNVMNLEKYENTGTYSEMSEKDKCKENGMPPEKRGPGRPPGAKNKKYHGQLTNFVTRAKNVKPSGKAKFGLQGIVTVRRKPGRPPGAKNKATLLKAVDNVETMSSSSKENSVVPEKDENPVSLEKETLMNPGVQLPVSSVDEAIESVLFKARNDMSLESNIKPRDPFKSSVFYKKLTAVKSAAKFKKEKTLLHKIRKRRILKAHTSDLGLGSQIENLPSNDLRRKLQSKLMQKISSESNIYQKANENIVNANGGVQSCENPEKVEGENIQKSERDPMFGGTAPEADVKTCEENVKIPPVMIEEKTIFRQDAGQIVDNFKAVRKPSIDITKFSDTDSVCSELSTNSLGSLKRNVEKQVLILGEDNMESDDQTVRTRQRFEIIPGKKRKRTLSGEFDLLDEKQLRKEKRKFERGLTDDESEANIVESVKPVKKPLFKKRKSPLKKSPNLKVQEGKIVKKYISQLTAYRHRMLKQSPFLSRVRKRRRKTLRKGIADALEHTNKTNQDVTETETNDQKPYQGTVNEQYKASENSSDVAFGSQVMKFDSYRKGLFEKFTDVTLQSKADTALKTEISDIKGKDEQEYHDSDDTEGTIELKDGTLNDDQEYMPVEESVDDSIIDFHTEENTESSSKVLYTESEIEVREMLFDLIDKVVMKYETKVSQQGDMDSYKLVNEKTKPESLSEISQVKTDNENKESLKEIKVDEISEKKSSNFCQEDGRSLHSEEKQLINVEQNRHGNENEVNVNRENNLLSETDPVVSDVSVRSGIQKASEKIKHKVRKKRLGPKSFVKKEPEKIGEEIKIRKKPGRKPKPKTEDAMVSNTDAKPHKMMASPSETKSSPETGTMRKFELRQKISRSPLDNIALKQSIEENVYLKNEAQKASRKEAKLKSKAKVAVQDSLDAISLQSKDNESEEYISTEMTLKESEMSETDDSITETIDDMLKNCRPCKVVLKDFLKELERTKEDEAENSYESETENNAEEEKESCVTNPSEILESNDSVTASDETISKSVFKTSDNFCSEDKNCGKPEALDICTLAEKQAIGKSFTEVEDLPANNIENKTDELSNSVKLGESLAYFGDENENTTKVVNNLNISPDKKQKELKPKRKTPVKTKVTSSPQLAVKSPKERKRGNIINEQQTARKTVPPLKIKVKGGFSRRKTYIVEPSPEIPVEQSSKNEHKAEKRREKSKTKSGNKSESDSEKHAKNHHHHKKRNKSPSDELNIEQGKVSASEQAEALGSAVNAQPDKPQVRATDAYEATFLQFIQDKDKVEQNLAAFSSSLGPRNKPSANSVQKTTHKDKKTNNILSTASSLEGKSTKVEEENMSVSVNNDSQNDSDSSEVQYMCSQCDNVVYRAKEQIIKHYRDVHPGLQFIYKPLPDTAETPTNESEPVTLQTERGVDNSSCGENTVNQTSVGENDQNQNGDGDDVDDDDSGSLNLKIVEVVSLKDQENIMNDEAEVSKEQVLDVASLPTSTIQTQLRIPSYPIPSGAPPPYSIISGPPPPYSFASSGTLLTISPGVKEVAHLKPQPTSIKPRPLAPSGKIGNSFKCEKCNVHAPMLAAMVAHLRNTHKEIPRLFQCPYCKDLEAETEAMIHQHIKKHHPTNNPNPPVALSEPAKRNLKTLSVRLPDGLKLGEGNSIEKDIYMCLRCKEHMPSLESIYEHLEHEHAEVFAYVCPVCKVFKSKTEELVNNHIIMEHRRSPVDVNVSLAIDGNHFVRVQCLIKDKGKSGQKATQPVSQKPQISPVPSAMQPSKLTMQVQGQTTTNVLHLQPIPQSVIPQEWTSLPQGSGTIQSLTSVQQQVNSSVSTSSAMSKPVGQHVQKKKKSLLESIQKIKDQKMEQQGLLPPKTDTSAAQIIPSHPSQLSSVKSNIAPGGVPPPLMRGPPPLIRYDQLNKVTSAQTALFGSVVRTSAQLTLTSGKNVAGSQSTQSVSAARPIQSSLFDTSDLDTMKSPQSQRPVLNVPVVSRHTNKSPFSNNQPTNSTTEGNAVVTTGSPLDLSKTTPTGSPAPQTVQATNPGQVQLTSGGMNPDVFQVFNLRPSTQMQLPRQQVPVQQLLAQPIMLPQQVRQNTPSTLAYRPAGPQMIATSQVPQIIGMPLGTAVIGNMVVSLGNVSQGVPTIPGVTQIPTLQTAQFVRMSSPQMTASAVTVLNSTATTPAAAQAQSKVVGSGQQVLSKNMLFKCPYCPNLTPLRLDQVQPHIEKNHPGSTILFKPFDSR